VECPCEFEQTQSIPTAAVNNTFPDLHHEIKAMVAEGDSAAVRLNVTDTHNGEFQRILLSGKNLSLDEMGFIAVSDGKSAEG
jgi:predicted ester cyclase